MFAYVLHPARASLLLALVSAAILLAALALQFLGGPGALPAVHLAALAVRGPGRARPDRLALAAARAARYRDAGAARRGRACRLSRRHRARWWALPGGCIAGVTAESVEELKRLLAEAPPACDQVGFTFLGLTLAGWNLVASLALAAYAAAAAPRRRAPGGSRLVRGGRTLTTGAKRAAGLCVWPERRGGGARRQLEVMGRPSGATTASWTG